MSTIYRAKTIYWIYLVFLSLAGMTVAWYSIASFGAGVGTDGAIQVSTADHLLTGQGLTDFSDQAFVKWPPLYPVTIAALSRISSLDTLVVAGYFNIFLFGAIIALSGVLLYQCFPDELLWAYLGSLAVALSPSLFSIVVNIGTDPMFTVLALAFLLAAGAYLKFGAPLSLALMAVFAFLAAIQRLPGVTLTAAGVIFIVLVNRQQRPRLLKQTVGFVILTALPLLAWVVIHNYLQNHTLFGIYLGVMTRPFDNLQDAAVKIFHWFTPYNRPAWLGALVLAAMAGVGLAAISKKADWQRLRLRLASPPVLASLVFGAVYLAFLVLTINSVDTKYPYYDRYYVVALVPVLILLFAVIQELALARATRRPALGRGLVLAFFLLWLIYPAFNFYSYAMQTRMGGAATYNLYNTRTMRQSRLVQELKQISQQKDRVIFSNYPAAVWFFTRQDAFPSPRARIIDQLDVSTVIEENKDWPGAKPAYLVWFLPNDYRHVLKPKQLERIARLELIYQGWDGEIYLVRP